MSVLLIALLKISHSDWEAEYDRDLKGLVQGYSGKYIVRCDDVFQAEGTPEHKPDRIVVIEFSSMETAKNWYNDPAYAPLIAIRQTGAVTDMYFVEKM